MSMHLHHVALASPRTVEAADFYTADWGLHEVARDDHSIRLGADSDQGDNYSLALIAADEKFVHHYRLATESEDAADALRERLVAGGVTILDGATTCPGLTAAFMFVDVDGRRVEVGHSPHPAPVEPDSGEDLHDAVPWKVGHIVLNTPDIETSVAWYEEKVGLGVRDWREKKMAFLYCNSDHHTVAFNAAPHVSLNHVAWELADINHFFRGMGRAMQSEGGQKLHGPGRHGPGNYIFCYFLDPMEFICEYETDGVKIEHEDDYEFRVWEYSPESVDQWLGTLSGGTPREFRKASIGVPDPGLVSA